MSLIFTRINNFVLAFFIFFVFSFLINSDVVKGQTIPAVTGLSLSATPTTITATWNIHTDTNVAEYEIQYCDGAGCAPDTLVTVGSRNVTSKTITGLTANETYRFRIRAKKLFSLIGNWSSDDEPSSASNIRGGGYVDTENNKLWLFDYSDGAYYKSIDASGVPTGNWSSADEPSSAGGVYGGHIDTENNKLWLFDKSDGAYYKSIDANGVPTGSWGGGGGDEPSTASDIRGGFVDTENNKVWLFDRRDGAYYKSIDASGVPTGNWGGGGGDEPSSASDVYGGHIDTVNDKLWLFDRADGAYYKSIDSNGVPTGSWSSGGGDEPNTSSSIYGGHIDTGNNKLWLFDGPDGAYYKSIDSNGVPTGSWSSGDEPRTASSVYEGFVDTENSKLWLFDRLDGTYYKSTSGGNSVWSSIVARQTLQEIIITAPTGLSLSATSSTMTATWNAHTDTSVTGYEIQYCDGVNCTPDTTVNVSGRSTTTHTISSLSPNTTHRVRIKATSSHNSTWSSIVARQTPQRIVSIPIGLSLSATTTSITASWNTHTDTNVTGYELQYCNGASCNIENGTTVSINSRTTTSRNITNLSTNTTYRVRIKATGSIDSSWSSIVARQTLQEIIITAPTGLSLSATSSTMTATWNTHTNSSVTGYEIQYCDGVNCTPDTTVNVSGRSTTTHTISSLSPNTTHRVRIKATSSHNSTWSSIVSRQTLAESIIEPPPPPPPQPIQPSLASPTNFAVTATETTVTATWTQHTDTSVTGYELQYCDGVGCTPDTLVTVGSRNVISKTITGLTANETYRFRIRATSSSDSAWSAIVATQTLAESVVVTPQPVASPANFAVTATSTTITATWNAHTDTSVTGYQIKYCSSENCTPVTPVSVSGRSITTKTIRNLEVSTTYRLHIRAVAGVIFGNFSAVRSIDTEAVIEGGGLVLERDVNKISAQWGLSSNANTTGYDLQYCRGASCTPNNTISIPGISIIKYNVSARDELTYGFRYREVIGATKGQWSGTVTSTSDSIKFLPIRCSSYSSTSTSITLNWVSLTSTNVTGYQIQYCEGNICPPRILVDVPGSSVSSKAITGLKPYTIYSLRVKVKASNSSRDSNWGPTLQVKTKLAKPTNIVLYETPTASTIGIEWDEVEGANRYRAQYCITGIDCDNNATDGWTNLSELVRRAKAFGLDGETRYRFRIRAENSTTNEKGLYAYETFRTVLLDKPRNLSVKDITTTSFVAEWQPPLAGEAPDSYEVQYCLNQ